MYIYLWVYTHKLTSAQSCVCMESTGCFSTIEQSLEEQWMDKYCTDCILSGALCSSVVHCYTCIIGRIVPRKSLKAKGTHSIFLD